MGTTAALLCKKQILWAKNSILPAQMSYFRDDYVNNYNDNLFVPLDAIEEVETAFRKGLGGETKDGKKRPAKLKSLRSSSALAINVFLYWHPKPWQIANAARLCEKGDSSIDKLAFEVPYEILPNHVPHLDVVLKSDKMTYAIESKFVEPYQKSKHSILDEDYRNIPIWSELESLKDFAFSEAITKYNHLHAGQLVKHALGLTIHRQRTGMPFNLIYLWYDVSGSFEAADHRKEIEEFSSVLQAAAVPFLHLTYQELIFNLRETYFRHHAKYFDYLINRYF